MGERISRKHASLWAICVATAIIGVSASPASARSVFVTNQFGDSVSVIDGASNLVVVGTPIAVGNSPGGLAITPDGARVYVANNADDNVSVIDVSANAVTGSPIAVESTPSAVAITPDGTRALVASTNNVSVINTSFNGAIGSPIAAGGLLSALAITPGGGGAFVADRFNDRVWRVDRATNSVVGDPIAVDESPEGVAITPNGSRVYIANYLGNSVSVINTSTNRVIRRINLGGRPRGLAITPNGARLYVTLRTSDQVTVVDTATNAVVGEPIPVGDDPVGIAITPDASRAYVSNRSDDTVSVIDISTNTVTGDPIAVGPRPWGVAIVPNQGPIAAAKALLGKAGSPTQFDASLSSDPDGAVARYSWDFGDGTTLPSGPPNPSHTYEQPGAYTVKLTVSDNEGCSARFLFTGQTASCNGSSAAIAMGTLQITADQPPPEEQELDESPIDELPPEEADTEAPQLDLTGAKRQNLGRVLAIKVGCDELCTATAKARLVARTPAGFAARRTYRLKKRTKEIQAGQTAKIKVPLSKKARRAAKKALRRDGSAVAIVRVTATDGEGNKAKSKRRVKIRRR